MMTSRQIQRIVLLVLLLALCAPIAQASAATTGKQYTLTIAPPSAGAGSRTSFSATFTNAPGQQQQLGSANLTAPAGFSIVSAAVPVGTATVTGTTVQLRNLALQPGKSVTVTIVADDACTAGSYQWTVNAKQSNDFNGPPGNDFTLVGPSSLSTNITGACALRFVTQPASARVGQTITGTAYTPTGPAISVETVDGNGVRTTTSGTPITMSIGAAAGLGTLGGTLTVSTINGLASFGDLSINAPGTYALRASTTVGGFTSVASNTFRVDTAAIACPEDITCTGTISDKTTKVDVTAIADPNSPDAGILTLSFGAGYVLDCAGYTEFSPDTTLLTYSTDSRPKNLTVTIDKKQMNLLPNNGASFLNLCFGAPAPFPTAGGGTAVQQGTFDWNADGTPDPVYVGLLPDCGAPPCVDHRNNNGQGDGVLTALLPAGINDPHFRP
jgi:hypothetical protein